LSIVNQLGNPLLTTSLKSFSNIEKSTDPYSIYETYKNQVDIVINGGVGNISPSTIIDFSKGEIEVIREGKGSLDIL
jgi:tRNA A37 threonylcarbamoyladenosine synthetase subunit TsaC/SUA5/YrdC